MAHEHLTLLPTLILSSRTFLLPNLYLPFVWGLCLWLLLLVLLQKLSRVAIPRFPDIDAIPWFFHLLDEFLASFSNLACNPAFLWPWALTMFRYFLYRWYIKVKTFGCSFLVKIMWKESPYFLLVMPLIKPFDCKFANVIIKFELISCRVYFLNIKGLLFLVLESMRITSDFLHLFSPTLATLWWFHPAFLLIIKDMSFF